ncbi:FAD binding domain-containing protein [Phenylobacterium deserti]|uniref:Xanthine dehydrogenase family protein subunit M n=1 Tax=Phenylobacterium deserti TaxID=1914756 RepID=A0A328A9P2_9CAUL|nr:xanthine dehydrogenase family protein subunit M [Phenylobacterium deserti]RAK51382.1 xanthine dehydrogenase family protein subunit M [Phenylobacterium deserti]
MALFRYHRPGDLSEAHARAVTPGAMYIAGGTDLLQLVQERVTQPAEVIDVNRLAPPEIETSEGGVRIGAGAKLNAMAAHPLVRERYPVVAEALMGSASPQVRNMATAGGNLLQRTRCLYFRDVATPCNKRQPGSGCSAWDGQNRQNAIFGGSPTCIAVQPSDFAVALLACDAEIVLASPGGERRVPMADFHRLPIEAPEIETVMEPGELITAIELPDRAAQRRSRYLKVRDRASFEWAVTSCALSIRMEGGAVSEARVAVGGVGTKPWRLPNVEPAIVGQALTEQVITSAAERAAEGAEPRQHNAFKVPLLVGTVRKALREFAQMEAVQP